MATSPVSGTLSHTQLAVLEQIRALRASKPVQAAAPVRAAASVREAAPIQAKPVTTHAVATTATPGTPPAHRPRGSILNILA